MKLEQNSLTAYGLYLMIIAVFAVIICYYPIGYIWATYEDLLGEWTQFYFFLFASFFYSVLCLKIKSYRLFFGFLAIACLYVAGEEISWGQRLFGFLTPDFFNQHNLQQETNLHNFFVGPYDTVLKRILEWIIAVLLVGFGLIYPLNISNKIKGVKWLKETLVPVPPFYLWPFFCTAALLELRFFRFNEAEVAEILLSLTLCFLALTYLSRFTLTQQARPAFRMIGLFVCCFILAGSTTYGLYQSSRTQDMMNKRIMAGVKKFAKRYGRYNQWQHASALYLTYHKYRPKHTEVMRRLGNSYQELGNSEEAMKYYRKALYQDMAKHGRDPSNVRVNLSLHRTFTLMENCEKATYHFKKALDDSKRGVLLYPENAEAVYWLGRTYETVEKRKDALNMYQKAVALKPNTKKYLKAVYYTRQHL